MNIGIEIILEAEGSYDSFIIESAGHLFDEGVITITTIGIIFGEYSEDGELIRKGMDIQSANNLIESILTANKYKIGTSYVEECGNTTKVFQLTREVY